MLVRYLPSVNAWTINPYNKCSHRCVYCISHGPGKSTPWVKKDKIDSALEQALTKVDPEIELGIGAMADAYPPEEESLRITREVLKTLSRLKRMFCINTKSDLVLRDIDLLKAHPAHCDVYMSIPALDDEALKILEPGAPPPSHRVDAIWDLHKKGILVGIDASPWIPGLSDIPALLDKLPPGIPIQVRALDMSPMSGDIPLLHFNQAEVDAAYDGAKSSFGQIGNVIWE